MAQLKFEIKDQWIQRLDNFKPVARSINYLYAEFSFLSPEWTEHTPTAIFRNATEAYEVPLSPDNTCLVPHEVLEMDEGEMFVSVFCGDLVTANKSRVHIYESGYGDDLESSEPPTPSVYEQIIERMDHVEDVVVDAASRSEVAADRAEGAVAHYPMIVSGYWFVWDAIEDSFVSTGIKAEAEDGTSATVRVEPTENGHLVIITDRDGDHEFNVSDGNDGRGIASIERINTQGFTDTYRMTFTTGEVFDYQIVNGASSTVSVQNIENGHRVTITDKDGDHAFDVMNGSRGADGYSPTVNITNISGGYNVAFTDRTGTKAYNVYDGARGADGVSPSVDVTAIPNGHRVTITDKQGIDAFDVMNGAKGDQGEKGDTGEVSLAQLNEKADVIKRSTSGVIASFYDGADNMPVKDLTVQINPVQEGEGDPSPTNVRSITGWDGASIFRMGKNFISPEKVQDTSTRVTLGQSQPTGTTLFFKAGTYTLSFKRTDNKAYAVYIRKQSLSSNISLLPSGSTDTEVTFTLEADDWCRFWIYLSGGVSPSDISDVQLEVGSTATDYEPYKPITILPISWQTEAGTVYGGTLDVTSGVLTVDMFYSTAMKSRTWTKEANSSVFSCNAITGQNAKALTYNYLCNKYKAVSTYRSNLNNNEIGVYNSSNAMNRFSIRDDRFDNVNDFVASLDDLVVVYELATPVVYSITSQELTTLLGENHIWADTGDIAVTYGADTKTYVDGIMPEVPVNDVQINGTSILSQGVADIPMASPTNMGAVKVDSGNGLYVNPNSGQLRVYRAVASEVKTGTNEVKPITPYNQHESAFYGLAKASGDTTQQLSTNPVGTYTDEAKSSIRSMIDAVGDVQINGTTIVDNGVANVPLASSSALGVVKAISMEGLYIKSDGSIIVNKADSASVKAGTAERLPIVPLTQHESAFYGLAKAAGSDEKNSPLEVGTYTDAAKVAIQKMLGIYEPPFRTIKEITITEETGLISVNKDEFLEDFSLKEMIIIFDNMIGTSNGAGFIVFNTNGGKPDSSVVDSVPLLSIDNMFYTSARTSIAHMWVSGGRFFGEGGTGYTTAYSRAGISRNKTAYGLTLCERMNNLIIYSANSYKFTSGTITIIGR